MLSKITAFFTGYVRFSFSDGFVEGFINQCLLNRLDINELIIKKNILYGKCSIKTYKKLHHLAFKSGGTVKIYQRCGLPFFTCKIKNRWGFLTGFVAFIMIISLMTGFIWNVDITGNNRISTAKLQNYLNQNNIKCGSMWSSINRKKLSFDIMAEFSDIGWAHINKNGTTAVLEINETTKNPKIQNETEKAKTKIQRDEISITISRTVQNSVFIGENKYKTLNFYWLHMPLYFSKKSGESSKSTNYLTIKNKKLPISITTDTEKYFVKSDYQLTDADLEKEARSRLKSAKEEKFKSFEIINENIVLNITSSSCIITGAYILREK